MATSSPNGQLGSCKIPESRLRSRWCSVAAKAPGRAFSPAPCARSSAAHSYHISDRRHLTGNFNAHLQNCCLLFADEAFWPGDKSRRRHVEADHHRTHTDHRAERCRQLRREEPPRYRLASNEKWVVPAEHSARRYRSEQRLRCPRKGRRDYFDPLQLSSTMVGTRRCCMIFSHGSWRLATARQCAAKRRAA